jgi:hypothetical protein
MRKWGSWAEQEFGASLCKIGRLVPVWRLVTRLLGQPSSRGRRPILVKAHGKAAAPQPGAHHWRASGETSPPTTRPIGRTMRFCRGAVLQSMMTAAASMGTSAARCSRIACRSAAVSCASG